MYRGQCIGERLLVRIEIKRWPLWTWDIANETTHEGIRKEMQKVEDLGKAVPSSSFPEFLFDCRSFLLSEWPAPIGPTV